MTLRAQLDILATNFANDVMAAVRSTSLQELIGPGREVGNGRREPVRGSQVDLVPLPRRKGKPGRLPRRSAEEISALLGKIVLLVKTHKTGMRAEEIRSKLGMQSKEMPRILKEGIATKKLTSKGQKRATTYFAR
jgi:hypothetical protein